MERLSTPVMHGRSPWALQGAVKASLHPMTAPLNVALRIPGSKSYTNRALILAGVARGTSMLRGFLRSDDSYWCIEALKQLGTPVRVADDVVTVRGCAGRWPHAADVFVGSAGTTARFLPGVLAAGQGGPWVIDGTEQLRRRPIAPVVQALVQLGGRIRHLNADVGLPLEVQGGGLEGGSISMTGTVSSQFISGILMAAPLAKKPVDLKIVDPIVQQAYVLITLDMMAQFGVKAAHDADLRSFQVAPQQYVGQTLDLEADASTAGYFFALAALTAGRLRLTNLGQHTRQPDIKLLEVLERMGCKVIRQDSWVEVQGVRPLRGGFTQSMHELSDQALTLAALAPFADAPIRIADVAHIRHHESDRIKAAVTSLRALGAAVEEHSDGLTIAPSTLHGATLASYDDHRVAMSMALVGVRVPDVWINDPGCVSKTCPTFFAEMARLGVAVTLA